jgi:hypothetical protein
MGRDVPEEKVRLPVGQNEESRAAFSEVRTRYGQTTTAEWPGAPFLQWTSVAI